MNSIEPEKTIVEMPAEVLTGIFGWLRDPESLINARRVCALFKRIIDKEDWAWRGIKETFGYTGNRTLDPITRYKNFIEIKKTKKLIAKYDKTEVPGDLKKILENKVLSEKQIRAVKEFIEARDTIKFWREVIVEVTKKASWRVIAPDFTGVFSSMAAAINKAKKFPEWMKKNQRGLDLVTKLSLIRFRLTTIPKQIRDLKNLKRFNLCENQFETIPEEIQNLKNLPDLALHYNQLKTVPAEIEHLKDLQSLALHANQIKLLPLEIGKLENLTILSLDENHLEALPLKIGKLTNLRELHLARNRLTSLPSTIGELVHLTHLRVSENCLETVPKEIGKLNKLEALELYSNQIKFLPPEIGKLTKLTSFYAWKNMLKTIPREIAGLVNRLCPNLLSRQNTSVSDMDMDSLATGCWVKIGFSSETDCSDEDEVDF